MNCIKIIATMLYLLYVMDSDDSPGSALSILLIKDKKSPRREVSDSLPWVKVLALP